MNNLDDLKVSLSKSEQLELEKISLRLNIPVEELVKIAVKKLFRDLHAIPAEPLQAKRHTKLQKTQSGPF